MKEVIIMFEKLMTMVNALVEVEDVYFREYNNTLYITVEDFEGFDKNYEEIYRELVNEELVDELVKFIKNANYTIENYTIELHYSSEDI